MVSSLKNQFTFESISEKRSIDIQLIMLVILLSGIGAVSLFSASWFFSLKFDKGPFYFFIRHLQFLGVGFILAFSLTLVKVEIFGKIALLLWAISILLNLLVFVPGLGRTISGGKRWFEIAGIMFQPSEGIKITLTIYLAYILDKKREMINDFKGTILPAIFVVGISSWVIIEQNDFSTAFFVFMLSVVLLFISGVRIRFLGIITGFCLLIATFVIMMQPYRIRRILSWLDPAKDPLGGGYQVIKSLKALYQGGFAGKGIGAGEMKLGHLPQAHSDFVFTVVGEEVGFVGIIIVITLFILLFFKGLSIAKKQESNYKIYIASGFSCAIFFQAMLNMGVVSGLFPPTGIPLPFFSQGGTSIIVTMIMIGFLLNLSTAKGESDE
ncbi:MAG: putative lipid II flippase FtsW [Spirochaetaceae bacterium]